jgi:hypothetical protein
LHYEPDLLIFKQINEKNRFVEAALTIRDANNQLLMFKSRPDPVLTFHGTWKTSLQTSLLRGERLGFFPLPFKGTGALVRRLGG